MNKRTSKIIGGVELLIASAIYGLYGLFYRNISEFGNFSQGYLRSSIIILILIVVFIFNRNKFQKYESKDLKWFIAWIIPSSLQPVMTFLAFNHLPVGLVYYLLYATMIVSSFISGIIFFREKVNFSKGLSFLFVVVGITFIYGSNTSFVSNIYVIFALLSGFVIGLWNTLTKKLSGNYSEEQMIFTDNMVCFLICLLLSLLNSEKVPSLSNPLSYLWLIVFALATLTTSVLVVKGFNKLEAQIGSLIVPMEILFGSLVGYIFLNESLSLNIYIGGGFILLAALLPYVWDILNKNMEIH